MPENNFTLEYSSKEFDEALSFFEKVQQLFELEPSSSASAVENLFGVDFLSILTARFNVPKDKEVIRIILDIIKKDKFEKKIEADIVLLSKIHTSEAARLWMEFPDDEDLISEIQPSSFALERRNRAQPYKVTMDFDCGNEVFLKGMILCGAFYVAGFPCEPDFSFEY